MNKITHNGKTYIKVEQKKDKEYYKKIADYFYEYNNGDYKWEKDGIQHLIRNNKEIAYGDYAYSFDNGDYMWRKDGVEYRIIENGTVMVVDGEEYKLEE